MKFIQEEIYKDKIGIYLITNLINGKVYVGKTEYSFIERYWNHVWKLDNRQHDNTHLERAWHKYGRENFEFTVYKVCSKDENISQLEIDTIKKFNSFNTGYNKTLGGDGTKGATMSEYAKRIVGYKNRLHNLGKKHSDETKKKMSEAHKGYIKTIEHRQNLSKSLTGKIVGQETRDKLRALNTGVNSPVTKFTEEDVVNIKTRLLNKENQKEIAKIFNMSVGAISAIANNRTWQHINVDGWEEYINNKKPRKKLTIEEVKLIKELLKDKNANCSAIARQYGVYSSTISGIKTGKYFSDIKIN